MLNYGFEFNDDYNHNFVWFYRGVYRFGCRGWWFNFYPALLAIGLPPSVALGTNKLASSFGSLTSAIKFIRSGKVDLYVVAKLFGFVFLASACGAYIATMVPSQILKPLIIIALSSVFIFTLLKKDWGNTRTFTQFTFKKALLFAALFILIGFYDGFVGGGTGSFMLFVLLIFGFDFLSAAGNAKVLNFASNIGALVLFMVLGQVDYVIGLVMAASMIVGSYAGLILLLNKVLAM